MTTKATKKSRTAEAPTRNALEAVESTPLVESLPGYAPTRYVRVRLEWVMQYPKTMTDLPGDLSKPWSRIMDACTNAALALLESSDNVKIIPGARIEARLHWLRRASAMDKAMLNVLGLGKDTKMRRARRAKKK